MATSDYKPIGDVVGPLEVLALPEGYIALDAVMVVKTLDLNGEIAWHTRYTKDPHAIEFLGALEAAAMLIKQDIFNQYDTSPGREE